MKIKGLGEITRSMKQLEKALAELDGDLASVSFDPDDPDSIEQAIQSLYSTIDEKVSSYSRNEIITGIAEELKENGRNAILERATKARLEQDGSKATSNNGEFGLK